MQGTILSVHPNNASWASGRNWGRFRNNAPCHRKICSRRLGFESRRSAAVFFQAEHLRPAPGTLALGSVISGNVTEIGEQHLFTFNGSAGQRIYFDSQDADGEQIYTRLVAPSGAFAWDFTLESSDIGPITLIENGIYTLVVDGSGPTVGDFRFRILDLAASALLLSARPRP